jgi:hypothetical protein
MAAAVTGAASAVGQCIGVTVRGAGSAVIAVVTVTVTVAVVVAATGQRQGVVVSVATSFVGCHTCSDEEPFGVLGLYCQRL